MNRYEKLGYLRNLGLDCYTALRTNCMSEVNIFILSIGRATQGTLRKHSFKVASALTISFHYNQCNWLHQMQQCSKQSKKKTNKKNRPVF